MHRSYIHCHFLLPGLLASALVCPTVRASSLSDLDAFTRSTQIADRMLSDRALQQAYRKALEGYSETKGPSAREFEKIWMQLAKLRKSAGGVGERLVTVRKPMAIQYAAPGRPTFRFERIAHAIHSVWLLESLREPDAACGPKDGLLVDRWTPLLKDSALFTVEKDGKFAGATLLLVPVRNGGLNYLLVSLNAASSNLPSILLEAFLRDYRQREPNSAPFALLTRDTPTGAYRISQVDAKGHRGAILGPVEGFRLTDPAARSIVAVAPTRCSGAGGAAGFVPAPREIASVGPAIVIGAGAAGGASTPDPNGANEKSNPLPAGSRASTPSTGVQLQGFGANSSAGSMPVTAQSRSANPANPVINNNISNQFSPVNETEKIPAPELVTLRGPASIPSSGSNGSESSNLLPVRSRIGAPAILNQPLASSGSSVQVNPTQYGNMTPNDAKLANAIQAGRNALENRQPIPPGTIQDVARGSLITQNTDLQKDAKKAIAEMYYKGDPVKGYEDLRQVQAQNPELAQDLIKDLNRDLCTYCKDCEYCRTLKDRAQGARPQ